MQTAQSRLPLLTRSRKRGRRRLSRKEVVIKWITWTNALNLSNSATIGWRILKTILVLDIRWEHTGKGNCTFEKVESTLGTYRKFELKKKRSGEKRSSGFLCNGMQKMFCRETIRNFVNVFWNFWMNAEDRRPNLLLEIEMFWKVSRTQAAPRRRYIRRFTNRERLK